MPLVGSLRSPCALYGPVASPRGYFAGPCASSERNRAGRAHALSTHARKGLVGTGRQGGSLQARKGALTRTPFPSTSALRTSISAVAVAQTVLFRYGSPNKSASPGLRSSGRRVFVVKWGDVNYGGLQLITIQHSSTR